MSRKHLVPILSSIFSVPLSAAAISQGSGSFQGIIPLITNLLGIDIGNPYNLLGVAATFGIMSLINYIMLKKAFTKMDMLDVVNLGSGHGSGEGRNILAILSVLMTISIVGTGSFMGLVSGFRGLILIMFALMLLAGASMVLSGGVLGGLGASSWVAGKSAKAASSGIKEGAEAFDGSMPHQFMNSVESKTKEVGSDVKESIGEMKEGHYEGAIQDVEEAEMIAEEIESELKSGEDEMNHELDEDLQRVKHMIDEESEEEEAVEDIHDRTERIGKVLQAWQDEIEDGRHNIHDTETYLNGGVLTEPRKAGVPADYSLNDIEEDVQKILRKDISVINEDIAEEESELKKELENLKGTLEASQKLTQWIKQLKKFMEQIEGESEEMEQLGQKQNFQKLFEEAEEIEDEDAQLEERINYLQQELEEIEQKQEEAIELLEKHFNYGEEEIRELKSDIEFEEGVEQVIGSLTGELANSTRFQNMDGSEDVYDALERIGNQIQEIESALQQELGEKEDEESTVNNMSDNLANMWEEVREST